MAAKCNGVPPPWSGYNILLSASTCTCHATICHFAYVCICMYAIKSNQSINSSVHIVGTMNTCTCSTWSSTWPFKYDITRVYTFTCMMQTLLHDGVEDKGILVCRLRSSCSMVLFFTSLSIYRIVFSTIHIIIT